MTIRAAYPDLAGRRALVTGASSPIGLCVAGALLEQGAGVAIHYRSNEAAARTLSARFPGRGVAIQADVSGEAGCVSLVREAARALGGIEILVHAAGVWNAAPIDTIEAARLEEAFRVNTFSAFYLVREALPWLRRGERGRGSIVFIGATAGRRGEAGHAHFAASKGALASLCFSLAAELAPAVRANIVSPGFVRTPAADPELGALVAGALPGHALVEVEDVANAVLYLASEVSEHLLGHELEVSGGEQLVVPRGQVVARHGG